LDIRPSPFLGFILLIGLRERAQRLSLSRDGNHSEFWMQRDNRTERLIPPPVHLVDEMAEELRRLSTWGERVADWWDRRLKCTVLSEREGKPRLLLGGPSAKLHYWVLPYSGGVLVELAICSGSAAAEKAGAILDQQDLLSERVPT
jgi:hypothetical protein